MNETPADDPLGRNKRSDVPAICLWVHVLPEHRYACSAPRAVQHSHHGFVEFGAFSGVPRGVITFYPWNLLPTISETPAKPRAPARDPLRLARYYQSLLDGGEFKTRAELARFLEVSRANVTQVLKRLEVLSTDLPIPDSA